MTNTQPLCPVFGECGGCQYQDIAYEDELNIKQIQLESLFKEEIGLEAHFLEPILPSPQAYHYRNRLDLKLLKTKENQIFVGFSPPGRNRMVPISACSIAKKSISGFIPALKQEITEKLPSRYHVANLVVRTGDDNRVFWGGVGRHSLRLDPQDYLWTQVNGRRIFYSLDTFFQANLSILPLLIERIRALNIWSSETVFFDLYSGVGFFGLMLADKVRKVVMIEESKASFKLAQHNLQYQDFKNVSMKAGRVEDELPSVLAHEAGNSKAVMIDPPRAGLSPEVLKTLNESAALNNILYLSCHPQTLLRDLKVLMNGNWKIVQVMPFDFFPKTKHIETLVWLKQKAVSLPVRQANR